MSSILDGLTLMLTPETFFFLLIGIAVSTAVSIPPGLGGLFALAILLPIAFEQTPEAALAMMMGVLVANGSADTITSVLFNVPASAGSVASTLDGYPMTRRGEGIRAVSAGMGAAVLGGLIGAAILAAIIPVLQPLVLLLRAPEFLAMIVLAMIFMAFVGRVDPLKGLISGGLGLLLACVGLEFSTATQRFTFGELYLWDGLPLVPFILGLFAVAEMVSLMTTGSAISENPGRVPWWSQMRQGLLDPIRHWKTTLIGSASGLGVGIAPGLGDTAAQFVGYGQAAKWSKNGKAFGTGVVEGVIGSEAATASKDGGALIPTLAFGIPGSVGMAILLAVFLDFGIQPGPEMLTEHLDIVWMIVWTLVIGFIISTILCLAITPLMARVTEMRTALIVPPVLLASCFGAYMSTFSAYDLLVLIAAGFVGWILDAFGYSRALLLIGFVLGGALEQNLILTINAFGWSALQRPITMGLLLIMVWLLVGPGIKAAMRRRGADKDASESVTVGQ
jgi:putative tricarboxylic transport membrane protein